MLRLLVSLALATFVSCDFDPELHEKYLSMERDEFVEYFNSQNYSYTIKAYDVKPVYGSLNAAIPEGLPVITYNDSLLANLRVPDNFDAREKWPECVTFGEIYDQGDCDSSWAFGTATTASDRICVAKGVSVRLSGQDFNCLNDHVCRGECHTNAFLYIVKVGLVTQECKPYDIEFLKKHSCDKKCYNGADYAGDKHRASYVYLINYLPEHLIKADLFLNGSIETMFTVREDFQDYKGGIYVHKYGQPIGYQSVRVIGYGEENGVPYWLAANSWGTNWGEKGFFRIKRYQKNLNFEINFLTVLI